MLFAVLVSLGMTFFMSLVLTLANLGLTSEFPEKWAAAFAVGFAVSLPISLFIIPIVKRIVDKLTTD